VKYLLPLLTLVGWCQAQSTQIVHLEFAGQDRFFYLRVPPTADSSHLAPLVVDLHGYTNPANGQRSLSNFQTKGIRDTFAVAWPQGIQNSWNASATCCGEANKQQADDVEFIKAVVNRARFMAPIDGHRVYITGHSNGAAMAQRMAIEASDVFAAVVDYAGWLPIPLKPGRAIPVLHFHAVQDTEVPFLGTDRMPAAESTLVLWKEAHGCEGEPDTTVLDSATGGFCQTYSQCRDSSQVALCRVAGDHMVYNNDAHLDITQLGWDFMKRFTLANPPEVVGIRRRENQERKPVLNRDWVRKKERPDPRRYLGRGWERHAN
jgi:polyhydroxybutyrate depolymerase